MSIFIFSLSSLSFAENNDLKSLQLYQQNEKSPLGAVAISWLVPSAGHAYAGDWNRGLKFLGLEVGEILVMSYAYADNQTEYVYDGGYTYYEETGTENDWIGGVAALAFLGTRVWEYFDAYDTAQDHNRQLKQSLGLKPMINFDDGQTQLTLQSNF
jgi:hypothetical protein